MNQQSRGFIQRLIPFSLATLLIGLMLYAPESMAQVAAITATPNPNGGQTYSLSVQTLILLTSMTFLPAILLMMTSFTRIIIVFGLLRQAIGTNTAPPNMVLIGLALFLTFFIMSPVIDEIHSKAYIPLNNGDITFEQAVDEASKPMRKFMLEQTRQADLIMFANMADIKEVASPDDVPMRVLIPAFATSELKTAFQIGFTIFIPFLIIDLVVASVLMALGMMMVPPVNISLPFKLMLFVLADGWGLLMSSLAKSFYQ